MRSTEDKSKRIEMVDMHQYFIERINAAVGESRYFEASWLIYACMENRFFRVLQKFKRQCKYCRGKCKKNKNELALSTKIACVERLCKEDVECISASFSPEQLEKIKLWVKKRNRLMHDLLSLETYKNVDDDFMDSSIEGQKLLSDLYDSCTNFRNIFYADDYEFVFPEAALENCVCAKKENV